MISAADPLLDRWDLDVVGGVGRGVDWKRRGASHDISK